MTNYGVINKKTKGLTTKNSYVLKVRGLFIKDLIRFEKEEKSNDQLDKGNKRKVSYQFKEDTGNIHNPLRSKTPSKNALNK